jgi:hypothetical protein
MSIKLQHNDCQNEGFRPIYLPTYMTNVLHLEVYIELVSLRDS